MQAGLRGERVVDLVDVVTAVSHAVRWYFIMAATGAGVRPKVSHLQKTFRQEVDFEIQVYNAQLGTSQEPIHIEHS